jgi:hypothetical protein
MTCYKTKDFQENGGCRFCTVKSVRKRKLHREVVLAAQACFDDPEILAESVLHNIDLHKDTNGLMASALHSSLPNEKECEVSPEGGLANTNSSSGEDAGSDEIERLRR